MDTVLDKGLQLQEAWIYGIGLILDLQNFKYCYSRFEAAFFAYSRRSSLTIFVGQPMKHLFVSLDYCLDHH